MKVIYMLLLVGSLLLNQSQAKTLDNVQVNGMAEYIPYKKSVYIAGLLTEFPVETAEEVFSLSGSRYMVLTVTADDWSPRNFSSHWRSAVVINNEAEDMEDFDLAFRRFAVMLRIDSLRQGDQIVIGIKDSDSPVIVTLNGKTTLEVKRHEFFNFMARAWIGKRPPSSSFRAALLKGTTDPILQDRFDELRKSEARVKLGI
jgi:hypothetical protein